jgi:polar amino acid transport system substrate-binding protein
MPRALPIAFLAALLGAALCAAPAAARGLDAIKASGTLAVCANPNALPFASKKGPRHGFQLDLAAALAHQLGVSLTPEWVITSYDIYRVHCDIVMDSIVDPEVEADSPLKLSKPYRRSGVALAVRSGDHIRSLNDLAHRQVGVLTSSIAAMTLNQRGIETVPDIFEDHLLEMLARHEIDAAAVTAASAGYYNMRHPKAKVRLVYVFDGQPGLSWNVAVGMRQPDAQLRQAIDGALTRLIADGTVKRVYARYGVEALPPH